MPEIAFHSFKMSLHPLPPPSPNIQSYVQPWAQLFEGELNLTQD